MFVEGFLGEGVAKQVVRGENVGQQSSNVLPRGGGGLGVEGLHRVVGKGEKVLWWVLGWGGINKKWGKSQGKGNKTKNQQSRGQEVPVDGVALKRNSPDRPAQWDVIARKR